MRVALVPKSIMFPASLRDPKAQTLCLTGTPSRVLRVQGELKREVPVKSRSHNFPGFAFFRNDKNISTQTNFPCQVFLISIVLEDNVTTNFILCIPFFARCITANIVRYNLTILVLTRCNSGQLLVMEV